MGVALWVLIRDAFDLWVATLSQTTFTPWAQKSPRGRLAQYCSGRRGRVVAETSGFCRD